MINELRPIMLMQMSDEDILDVVSEAEAWFKSVTGRLPVYTEVHNFRRNYDSVWKMNVVFYLDDYIMFCIHTPGWAKSDQFGFEIECTHCYLTSKDAMANHKQAMQDALLLESVLSELKP